MASNKIHPPTKPELHPRNRHKQRYDLQALAKSYPALNEFVQQNDYGDESIDFFKPEAVKALNTALLFHFYKIGYWDFPKGFLCPPIPGRADYIHHLADLLAGENRSSSPEGNEKKVRCLDVGTGASCIYPIIGSREYGWQFVGTEVDIAALSSAKKIVEENPYLKEKIELRIQAEEKYIFKGIIQPEEKFDLTMCNPPFHASEAEALEATQRKVSHLKHKKVTMVNRNFGGKNNELWCPGGEKKFIRDMILESREFSDSCQWFTTLVSKEANLKSIYRVLEKVKASSIKTISMGQGNKKSRIVAWRFF